MTDSAATHADAGQDAAGQNARGQSFPGWRSVPVCATAVLIVVALFGIGVLLPYFVNGLHVLPLADVANGAYDPKDLWPQSAWAGPVQLVGILGVTLLPLVTLPAVVVGTCGLAALWRRPRPDRAVMSLALSILVAVSASALAFWSSGTGEALSSWRMD